MDNYLVAMAVFAGLYALLALGLNVVWGMTGMINLGLVGFFGLGAYVSALLCRQAGAPITAIRNVSVVAFTKTLADALGQYGVNATVVHPSTTRTEATDRPSCAAMARNAESSGRKARSSPSSAISGTAMSRRCCSPTAPKSRATCSSIARGSAAC